MANNYCSITEVIELMPDTGLSAGDYDALLTVSIERASRMIDKEVGRWEGYFHPSTAYTIRYYDGNGDAELRIDEAISISEVAFDIDYAFTYTALGSTDWYAHPYNRTPIKSICLDLNNGEYGTFDEEPKFVRVTGVFGYSATPPADVKLACAMQAVRYFRRGLQAFRDTGAGEAQGSQTFPDFIDPEVRRILAHYVTELQV